MKKLLSNRNNPAVLGISNNSGIIIDLITDELLEYQFIAGGKASDIESVNIDYYIDTEEEEEDNQVKPGFKIGNDVYFLDEFIRLNY